ncbi:DUF5683 domain-containing protein [Lutibacter sp.]|uniref:DUF5683 domain-containing protein n=1 Tax=Lutibacter sp. TaxID=1925666 RepID=UPI00273366AD|nr:DUF5683 domain-containing protein [Lutibacter sp.]MDP3314247.1 DUF5683 domain-containing protein [Lutibacter sp.]
MVVAFANIFIVFSQKEEIVKIKDTVKNNKEFNALSPSKSAFYSAILPGLGQAYNKKYWKIPFVYGALGTSIYFYSTNNSNFNRVRNAYKLRLNEKPDEFDGKDGNIFLSKDALVRAQKSFKKDKDLSLLVTAAFYVLQILEASTNAHLLQHDIDDNISFKPNLTRDFKTNKTVVGASLNFNF